jgi:hypothetical protein
MDIRDRAAAVDFLVNAMPDDIDMAALVDALLCLDVTAFELGVSGLIDPDTLAPISPPRAETTVPGPYRAVALFAGTVRVSPWRRYRPGLTIPATPVTADRLVIVDPDGRPLLVDELVNHATAPDVLTVPDLEL